MNNEALAEQLCGMPALNAEERAMVWRGLEQRVRQLPQPHRSVFLFTRGFLSIFLNACPAGRSRLRGALLTAGRKCPLLSEVIAFHEKIGAALETELRFRHER